MSEHAKLMREAAWHLRATSGVDYYPLAVTLEAAAAELDKAEPDLPEITTIGKAKLKVKSVSRLEPPSAGVPDGLAEIHDWLLSLSCYPDSCPNRSSPTAGGWRVRLISTLKRWWRLELIIKIEIVDPQGGDA